MEPDCPDNQVVASDQGGLALQVLQPGMVPCEVCGAPCSKRIRVSTQLCTKDVAKRKKFHEQSVRAGRDRDLCSMETDNHEVYMMHLIKFCEGYKPSTKGPRAQQFTYDFCQIVKTDTRGVRTENKDELTPMAWPEYLAWFTEKAPSYCRLNEDGARKKWQRDTMDRNVKKDQVQCLDANGMPSNKMAWRIWVCTGEKAAHIKYQDVGSQLNESKQIKSGSDGPPAMLHKQHQIETDDLFNLDVDVDLGSSSSRAITGPVSTSSSKAKSNAAAKTQPPMLADKEEGDDVNKIVSKSCKGTKDPVTASHKVRKTTLKIFNQLITKIDLGISECKRALETIHADYDCQEQRDACNTYKEVHLRLNILKHLSVQTDTSPDANTKRVSQIRELIREDNYFGSPDAELDLDRIQTVGYMAVCRDNFAMLDSVASVLWAANDHMKSIDAAKSLGEAAVQSAKQCLATRNALRQARLDEQNEAEKEKIRIAKAAEAAEKKRVLQKEKDEEKERKRLEKEAQKQQKEEKRKQDKEKEKETDDADKQKGRRRGRGSDELVDGVDPACLTNKFTDCEVRVVDSQEEFAKSMIWGSPVVWRARRPPFKKVLQSCSPSMPSKELNSACTLLQAEWKSFLSKFAEEVAADQSIVKRNKACSAEVQGFREALSFDRHVAAHKETELVNPDPTSDDDDDLGHCVVMEEAVLKEQLDKFRDSHKGAQDEIMKRMQHEVSMYSTLHMVGQNKGKVFSGHFGGLYPHVVYQLEGTKAIALVRASEAVQHAGSAATDATDDERWALFLRGLSKFESISTDMDITMESFCQAWINPGDVLYIPAGFLIVEKALVTNSVAYRVCSNVIDMDSFLGLEAIKKFFPLSPGPCGMVSYVRNNADGWPEEIQKDGIGSDVDACVKLRIHTTKRAAQAAGRAATAALRSEGDQVIPQVSQPAFAHAERAQRVALIRKQLQRFREPPPKSRKSSTKSNVTSINTDDDEFGFLLGLRPSYIDYDESSLVEAYLAVRELAGVEVKKEDGSIASMVPIQLGVTTLPTEQVLEEMTSEINKGNEALGLSSPPSEPLPCPVESPNKPIEATLQPQQPLTGEGAAAAVQQSEISMAGSGCWPQKESDVEVKGPEKSVPEIVPSSSETSLVSNLTTSSTGTGTTETSTTTSTTTTTSGSTVTTTTTSSEQLEQPAVEQPQPPQEEHAGEDLQEHAAGNVNSTGGNDGSELAHPQDDRKEDVDKNENVAADDTEVGEEKADEEAPNAKQTLEVQSEAEPVQPVTKRAKTLADVQASAKASAKAKAKAKPKAAIKTNSRAAAKRPVQSDGHGSMNISEAMMKAAGAKKLKTGTGNGARK